jgi:RNA polymerase primary sigma factor
MVPLSKFEDWDAIPKLTPPLPKGVAGDDDASLKVPRQGVDGDTVEGTKEISAMQLYLHDIGKYPRITAKEEVQLAEQVQKGDEAAKDRMIQANLRLVVKIAQDYGTFGVPVLDLIAEGNVGLIRAIERFDPTKGVKLSTYAAWWIKQYIKRALSNQSKTIRLPVHLVDRLAKIRRVSHALEEQLGREPHNQEIATALKLPVSKVAHLKTVAITPASLEEPTKNDSDAEALGNFIPDEKAIDPATRLTQKTSSAELKTLLQALSRRESDILNLRFGLDGQLPMTLEAVGSRLGLTRERVRQMQEDALFKLRSQFLAQEDQKEPMAMPMQSKNEKPDPLIAFFRKQGYTLKKS